MTRVYLVTYGRGDNLKQPYTSVFSTEERAKMFIALLEKTGRDKDINIWYDLSMTILENDCEIATQFLNQFMEKNYD